MMKKVTILLGILTALILLTSCEDTINCVGGQGQQVSIDLEISNFHSIAVEGAVNIELTQGSEFESVLIVEPNIFEVLIVENNNGTLFIGSPNDVCISTPNAMTLRVTAPDYRAISVAGVSIISATNDLELNELTISAAGAVFSDLSGTCTTQNFNISGAAEASHFDLISEVVNIEVSGSGNFDIFAENELDIIVSGSALINYKGNPQISQNVSGSITLNDAN